VSGITLSASVRQNLLSLQSTASLLATTQNDLATGNKVNSALDNPTSYFTAQGLNNRAGDINNLLDQIGNGVQVLQAANTGITSLQSLVSSAQSIANQVLQAPTGYSTKSSVTTAAVPGATADNLLGTQTYTSGTFTSTSLTDGSGNPATIFTALTGPAASRLGTLLTASDDLTVNGKTIGFNSGAGTTFSATGASIDLDSGTLGDILTAINTITGTTTASLSGDQLVLASGTGASGVTVGGSSNALVALALTASDVSSGLSSNLTSIATTGTQLLGADTGPLSPGSTLDIASTGGGDATSITFGTGADQVSTLNQLNTDLAANNLQASIDSTGAITITTTNNAASSKVGAITGTSTNSGNAFAALTAGGAAPVADPNSQATRASLVAQYNQVIQNITTTAQDSSFNGINLLNGDSLNLTFDETGESKLSVTGVTFNATGLGLSSLTVGTDFLDNNSANKLLTTLTQASTTLRTEASALGSNLSVVQIRQDFNKNLINVLQTGASNLTLADTNEEAADSQALSTRQSIAVSALALANSSQQSVLQLLR
jgi:flagellin